MNLYIETENGVPKNHPATEDNILQAFDCIPENWKPFVRVERPVLGEYEFFTQDKPTYEMINGVWTDVWHKQEMTAEEKSIKDQAAKQNEINVYKTAWANLPQRDNFSAWVFNEETVMYEPPIPRPTDREVIWSGANNGWVDKPQKPDDGKEYTLDFYTSSWVEITQE
jgi:hypothetical protein